MTRPIYVPGDYHAVTTDFARVHRPLCVVQQNECGCSLALVPSRTRYFIVPAGVPPERRGDAGYEVTRGEYELAQAAYRAALAAGQVP